MPGPRILLSSAHSRNTLSPQCLSTGTLGNSKSSQERSGKKGRNAQAQGVPRKGFSGTGMRSGITPEFSMAHSAILMAKHR